MSTMHKHTRHYMSLCKLHCLWFVHSRFLRYHSIFTVVCTHVSPSTFVLSICQSLLALLLFVQYVSIYLSRSLSLSFSLYVRLRFSSRNSILVLSFLLSFIYLDMYSLYCSEIVPIIRYPVYMTSHVEL